MTIRRPDGSYIYHFAHVVDDIEMKVTHVLRGEDHLPNTWKHLDLMRALGVRNLIASCLNDVADIAHCTTLSMRRELRSW